jgi:hypothetical protein
MNKIDSQAPDILERTLGAWKRKESVEQTVHSVRADFRGLFFKHWKLKKMR